MKGLVFFSSLRFCSVAKNTWVHFRMCVLTFASRQNGAKCCYLSVTQAIIKAHISSTCNQTLGNVHQFGLNLFSKTKSAKPYRQVSRTFTFSSQALNSYFSITELGKGPLLSIREWIRSQILVPKLNGSWGRGPRPA